MKVRCAQGKQSRTRAFHRKASCQVTAIWRELTWGHRSLACLTFSVSSFFFLNHLLRTALCSTAQFWIQQKNQGKTLTAIKRLNVSTYSHLKSTWNFELKCIFKIRHGQQGQIVLCKKKVVKTLNYKLLKSIFVFGYSWQANSGATEISLRLSSAYDGKAQSPLFHSGTGIVDVHWCLGIQKLQGVEVGPGTMHCLNTKGCCQCKMMDSILCSDALGKHSVSSFFWEPTINLKSCISC